MVPVFIFMLTFTVFPIFGDLYLSLSKYGLGVGGAEFIGLEDYVKLAGSRLFWRVTKNTIVLALMTVIPSMVVDLGLVILINHKDKRVGFIHTTYFYPVVMPIIAIASVWMFIYMAKNDLFDQLLITIDLKPVNTLSSKNMILSAMTMIYVQKGAGCLMVFFLSGIQGISGEAMEAARIDGADSWTVFRRIIMPLLAPTFLLVSTIALTSCSELVDHVVIMAEGAPNNASTLLLYYIYQQGFINFSYGVSSALTVVALGLLFAVSLPRSINRNKKIYYN